LLIETPNAGQSDVSSREYFGTLKLLELGGAASVRKLSPLPTDTPGADAKEGWGFMEN
jgi:hypothetical protein